jgi:beta-phosphoglucomutase-like phosphatase (HAD superfamily)
MKNPLGFHACIFDFDGILVDSEVVLVRLWKEIAAEYQYQFEISDFFPCLGRTAEDIKQIQLDKFGEDYPFDAIFQKVQDEFRKIIRDMRIAAGSGVLELGTFLEESHIRMAVCQFNLSEGSAVSHGKGRDRPSFFPSVLGGDDIRSETCTGYLSERAAQVMQVDPGECLVLEDSQSGVLAASGGMHCCGCTKSEPGERCHA